jgi:cytoskeletal protein RodZ
MQKPKEKQMQKPKLIVLSVLATLLVCSAFSVAAAQEETPQVPQTANDTVTSTISPDKPESTPFDGNTSAPDVGDLDPIYEANGEPAFGAPEKGVDTDAPLIAPAPNSTAPDNTLAIVAIVVALVAIVGGVVGVVYRRKQTVETPS